MMWISIQNCKRLSIGRMKIYMLLHSIYKMYEKKNQLFLNFNIMNEDRSNAVIQWLVILEPGRWKGSCDSCGNKELYARDLPSHNKVCKEIRPFKCSETNCGASFIRFAHLDDHIKGVHNGQESICHICGKKFKWEHNLHRHMYAHNKPKNYICQYCGRGFDQSSTRNMHEKVRHTHLFKCKVCQKHFVDENERKEHICEKPPPSKLKPRSFKSKPKHSKNKPGPKKTSSGPVQCNFCKLVLWTENGLKQHKTEVHLLPFKCSACLKRFSSETLCQEHQCSGNTELFHCEFCRHPFLEKATLDTHRKLHTHKFKCSRCSKRFESQSSLDSHNCPKSGEKPKKSNSILINRCKICNIDFESYQEHLAHKKQHEIYPCPYCPKSFMSRKLLWGHKDYAHSGKRSKMKNQTQKLEVHEISPNLGHNSFEIPYIVPQPVPSAPVTDMEPTYNFPNLMQLW